MHIFLTGERQAGKTTALRKYLKASGGSADGIVTRWEPQSGNPRYLFLRGYATDEKHLLAADTGRGVEPVPEITQVFDTYGFGLLARSGNCDYIIIDELGTLEREAFVFQEAVMRCLDGSVPVLGVLSVKESAFLDRVRNHPKVRLVEVTAQNRDNVI